MTAAKRSMLGNSGGARLIDLDPMVRHLGSHLRALPVEDDLVGLLPGHVAINAVFCKGMAGPGEGCRVRLVTAQAALRKVSHVVLRGVNIVASEAGHV